MPMLQTRLEADNAPPAARKSVVGPVRICTVRLTDLTVIKRKAKYRDLQQKDVMSILIHFDHFWSILQLFDLPCTSSLLVFPDSVGRVGRSTFFSSSTRVPSRGVRRDWACWILRCTQRSWIRFCVLPMIFPWFIYIYHHLPLLPFYAKFAHLFVFVYLVCWFVRILPWFCWPFSFLACVRCAACFTLFFMFFLTTEVADLLHLCSSGGWRNLLLKRCGPPSAGPTREDPGQTRGRVCVLRDHRRGNLWQLLR